MQAGFILSLIFAIIVALFALKNANSVLIDFIFAKIEVSQAIVIFVSAALGAVIVTMLGIVRQIKLSMKVKEQGKKIESLETQKNDLENRIEELLKDNTQSTNITGLEDCTKISHEENIKDNNVVKGDNINIDDLEKINEK